MSFAPPNLAVEAYMPGLRTQFAAELGSLGGASFASAAYPANNLAIYVPMLFSSAVVVRQLWWANGASVSGTVDVALYDASGANKVVASGGGVTQAGTSAPQAINVTDALVVPGRYWLGIVSSTTAATFQRWTGNAIIPGLQKFLGFQQESLGSAAMPSSTTFAANTNLYIPLIGVSLEANAP